MPVDLFKDFNSFYIKKGALRMEGRTEQFSNILKDYVLERKKVNPKISENQIAQGLGISQTTFYRMLNYNTYPSVRNLLKLCKSG